MTPTRMDKAVRNVTRRCWFPAQTGAARDRLEHRLHVRRRAGDDLQDVGRGGLPLQRFLGLVEQPRVLDRDHGLVGETLLERKLFVGEGQEPVAEYDENADCLALAPERRATHGAGTPRPGMGQARPVGH